MVVEDERQVSTGVAVGSGSPMCGRLGALSVWSVERRVLPPTTTVRDPAMLRFTRPLFDVVTKKSTGITGLKVHHDPLPELKKTYEATLQTLSAIPLTSVYRQGTEALTQHKLNILERANGAVAVVEKELDEGRIEQSVVIAQDELSLANNMFEWKA